MVTVVSLESRITDRFKAQGEPGYEFIIDFQLDSERDLPLLKDLLNVFVDSNCYEVSTMAEKEDFVDVICRSDFGYGTEIINCLKVECYTVRDKVEWFLYKRNIYNSFERTIDEWDLASDEMKVLESTYLIGFFLKAMRRLNSGYISLEEANSDKYIEILESFKEIKKFIAQKINDKNTNDEVKSSIKKYCNMWYVANSDTPLNTAL
ncbi:hypothetical protein [Capnocytophaga gingivalis]